MSVWIVSAPVPDSAQVQQAGEIALPFADWPDYTQASSFGGLRQMLRAENPEITPEALSRRAERIWHVLHAIGEEDILAIPQGTKVTLAIALSGVRYKDGAYVVAVRWMALRKSILRFGRYHSLFTEAKPGLHEVQDAAARTAIRNTLPLPGNRFRRMKWLLVFVATIQSFYFISRFAKQMLHSLNYLVN